MGNFCPGLSGLSDDFYAFWLEKPDMFAFKLCYFSARQNGNDISNYKIFEDRAKFELIEIQLEFAGRIAEGQGYSHLVVPVSLFRPDLVYKS